MSTQPRQQPEDSRPAAADTPAELKRLAEQLIEQALELGATAAEAGTSSQRGLSATVRMGEVETVEHHRDRSLSLTLYQGQRKGTASCGDLRPESLRETLQRAWNIARHIEPDQAAGLADRDLLATHFPDLRLWHPRELSAAELIEWALLMEQAGRELDHRIVNSEGATCGFAESVHAYANSHGFAAAERGTGFHASIALVARSDAGNGVMQRDYDWDQRRRYESLAEPAELGRRAAERTLRRLGARRAATTKALVLFTPEAARSLLGHLVSAVSGGAIYRQASFLLDHIGQPVFPDWVRIAEQPLLPGGIGSASFDHDGVATGRHDVLVQEGRLQRYVLDCYSARRLGLATTGNAGGVRNLRIEPGAADHNELIASMPRGVVVTELMGQGINPVTGDYSRGASGFWVEHGQLAYPVEEVTIAGNLRDMFRQLLALGNDLDDRANLQTPSWLIDGMTIAGE